MTLTINGKRINELISLETVRRARNLKKHYNANGDLLIDTVARKYTLTVCIGMDSYYRFYELFRCISGVFVPVEFESPFEGTITRNFFLAEEPCETSHTAGALTYYKAVRLVFEEE